MNLGKRIKNNYFKSRVLTINFLVPIDDSDEAFKIKTIRKVEENQLVTYDVVSNGNGWYECDADGIQANTQLPSGGLEVDTTKANRFQCYREGGQYSVVK